MPRFLRPVLALLALVAALPVSAGDKTDGFFFKPNDRVMFLGDSITEQYQYSSDIELYLTTRFPTWNLTFLNAGIGGDTAHGGAGRFEQHVLAEKPTVLTINFGMNDGGYGAFNAGSNANYVKHTEAMLAAAQKAGVRVALVSPNAVDRRGRDNFKLYLETQKQYYAPLKDIAQRNQVTFVDQYDTTRRVLERIETAGDKNANPFPDGVHTSSGGGLLMAHTILTGLHAPALVSSADIDAAAGQAKTARCKVNELKATKTEVSFERLDEALPIPVQKDWVSILPYVNNLGDLNDYGLKVTGLDAGKYQVSIDGKAVATYGADELAKGVNLGLLTAGPIHDQGQKVFQKLNDKNQIVHNRFNNVVRFNAPDWLADVAKERKNAELKRRLEEIAARQGEIDRLATPVPRRFEVKRAADQ